MGGIIVLVDREIHGLELGTVSPDWDEADCEGSRQGESKGSGDIDGMKSCCEDIAAYVSVRLKIG